MALRELVGLVDGVCECVDKPSENKRAAKISQRMKNLFFSSAPSSSNSGGRRLTAVHNQPPIYLVPHFLTARELDHIDELLTCERRRFRQSHTDASEGEGSYVGEYRTSISLPLPKGVDATLRAIETKAADLVGLPSDHVEPLQVVHYSEGARFDMHHDVAPIKLKGDDDVNEEAENGIDLTTLTPDEVAVERQEGPRRLVTLFVYLNTLPEGVGHTEFPLLRDSNGKPLSIRPRCGTALLFCNVDEEGEPDARACHRACPVPAGHTKFGVNIWISDVSQQAHAVEGMAHKNKGGTGAASGGKGILAPLLFTSHDDLPPPPPNALVGLVFSVHFEGHGYFDGTVMSHDAANGYHLEYTDGDEEDIGVDELLELKLSNAKSLIGRRVSRHFPGHGRFEGEVTAWQEEGERVGYKLRYDDGDEESEIPMVEVLKLLMPESTNKKGKAKKRGRPSVE